MWIVDLICPPLQVYRRSRNWYCVRNISENWHDVELFNPRIQFTYQSSYVVSANGSGSGVHRGRWAGHVPRAPRLRESWGEIALILGYDLFTNRAFGGNLYRNLLMAARNLWAAIGTPLSTGGSVFTGDDSPITESIETSSSDLEL